MILEGDCDDGDDGDDMPDPSPIPPPSGGEAKECPKEKVSVSRHFRTDPEVVLERLNTLALSPGLHDLGLEAAPPTDAFGFPENQFNTLPDRPGVQFPTQLPGVVARGQDFGRAVDRILMEQSMVPIPNPIGAGAGVLSGAGGLLRGAGGLLRGAAGAAPRFIPSLPSF